MMITLTYPGGQEVRVNTDAILYYVGEKMYRRLESTDKPQEIDGTRLTLSVYNSYDDGSVAVLESPEEIDSILRTNLITVYQSKR